MFEDDDLPQDQDIKQPDVETTDDLPDDEPSDEPQGEQDDEAKADDDLDFSFDEPENDSEGHDPFAGQAAPEWVKQLRKENRELKKQLKQTPQQPQVAPLREKPTITDHDFDSEAYEADLEQWFNEKAQHDEVINAQKAKDEAIDNRYVASVDKMRKIAPDYDEVEDTVVATLSPEKQALLKLGVEDTAKLVYALGKSPNKLAELEQLDPVSFVKQLGIMEFQMSQKSRNPNKPQPKSHELTGAAGGGDSKLAKLEAEAAKTGDRTAIREYRKRMKQKS